MRNKYNEEVLRETVGKSFSVSQVLRLLGLAQAGGTHSLISRKIKLFGIETSHFLGKASNRGNRHKGSKKKNWQDILILRSNGRRQEAHKLRRALIESGIEYRCNGNSCSLSNEWLGKFIILHVNHKNTNWLDDRQENLEFLCPNCHSQTVGYCGSKNLSSLTSRAAANRLYRKRKSINRLLQPKALASSSLAFRTKTDR